MTTSASERGFDLLHRMTRREVLDDVRAVYDHLAARHAGVAGIDVPRRSS